MKQFLPVLITAIFFSSCAKESVTPAFSNDPLKKQNPARDNITPGSNGNILDWYNAVNPATLRELQQARAATARYRILGNALADGYEDIAVDVENMGHHYMKRSIVDGVFNVREPEILVYNRDEDGAPVLVAVEYAVPISQPEPVGFYGNTDIWNGTSEFPLWLLHAWVWAYNPDGVFNPTNPLVHLH